jgi:hypothetical protein
VKNAQKLTSKFWAFPTYIKYPYKFFSVYFLLFGTENFIWTFYKGWKIQNFEVNFSPTTGHIDNLNFPPQSQLKTN